LSETCKYLFLLFDEDNFVNKQNFIFTTEGHPLPMNMPWHKNLTNSVRDVCVAHIPKRSAHNIMKDLPNNLHDHLGPQRRKRKDQCEKDEAPNTKDTKKYQSYTECTITVSILFK